MILVFSNLLVLFFGIFLILVGLLMLIKPQKARNILRKAASSNLINYTEITIRMIPAVGLILAADQSKSPDFFKILGWFMLFTSLVLYIVPRRWHHNYALKCAEILTPFYIRMISPFSILFGVVLIYCISNS
ncbi:MAG: hypothetical protein WBN28_02740 [Lutimonas sp.]|jgi:uncharacterized membrane protein YfcA